MQVLHDFHAFAQVSEADVSCLMESTDMLDALRGQINLCHSHIEELNVRHQQVWSLKQKIIFFTLHTGNDVYSGDRYSGNDRYTGLTPPDDAILFTVSGITAIADKKCWRFLLK